MMYGRLLSVVTLNLFVISCRPVIAELPVIKSDTIDGVAKSKSRVVLTCEVADPTSSVIWTLDGRVIGADNSLGISFSNETQDTMIIEVFRASSSPLSQGGDWRCSSNGLVSRKLTLAKARIKNFSRKKDIVVTATEGSTALLPCKPPKSRPRADTVFEIHGSTIDESRDRYYLLSSGDLQISDVRMSDNGTYKCVAINKVLGDKIQAPYNIILNVQPRLRDVPDLPPPIVFQEWSWGPRFDVEEGNELMLPCATNSNPPPSISWEKYPSPLPPNRTRVVHTNLLISNLNVSDSGTYNCLAEHDSSPSPAVLTYIINVLMSPRVSFSTKEFFVEEGSEIVIPCPLTSEPSEETTVVWYREGTVLRSGRDLQVAADKLTIKNVTQSHAALYQCIVGNEVGEDTDYMKLYVQKPRVTTTTTTPLPTTTTPVIRITPDTPQVVQIRRNSFQLTWSISSIADLLSYQIKMREETDDWVTIMRDIPKQATTMEISRNLLPGLRYKFMVVAVYRRRVHLESKATKRILLDPLFGGEETTQASDERAQRVTKSSRASTTTTTAPSLLAADLGQVMIDPPIPEVVIVSSTELLMKWEPIIHGIPVSFYKVQMKTLGPTRSGWYTVLGTIRNSTTYKITKLLPGVSYKIKLAAVYENNQHRIGPTIKVTMPEGSDVPHEPPRAAPRITTVKQTGEGTLVVDWVYSSQYPIKEFVVQYQVSGRVQDMKWLEKVIPVRNSNEMEENEALLTGLGNDQVYVVRVLSVNDYGRSHPSNMFRRRVMYPFPPVDPPTTTEQPREIPQDDKLYTKKSPVTAQNDMLYIILGAVLGSMVLLLIIFVAICGFKQRQQRRAMLATSGRSHNKFADASKVLYGEQLKQQPVNGTTGQFVTLNGGNGALPNQANGTLPSVHSQRMSLNINPLDELDESHQGALNGDVQTSRDQNTSLDYNLMQHYPHYNSGGSRHTPTYHHSSHHSIDAGSQHNGSTHYSHGSLPHYNVHQQYEPVRSTTPQFSTFLPRATREASPLPSSTKLPHPQGLRPVQYSHSPASSVCEGSQGSQQRRRRKKRSQHNRDRMINQSNSNPGSAREYNTNTDMSSGEGTGAEEYTHALPPPPMLSSSYTQPQPYPSTTETVSSNGGSRATELA